LSGWIKTHRKMLQSSVFKNPELFKTWMWCLMKATHKPHKQMVGMIEVELKEGQFIFGRKQAALELNLNESKIYRFIKSLEKQTKVELKPNNKFTIVTIVNWGVYQDTENENEQQMNNKRTTNEQQMNTNKNVKNVKNEKNDKTIYRRVQHLNLSQDDFEWLNNLYNRSDIDDVLDQMENFAGLKKYKSAKLTANNWLKKRNAIKGNNKIVSINSL